MEGKPVTVIMYHCICTCLLSVVSTMSEQVVPSAVAQFIVVKFLTNKNVDPAKLLMRFRAKFIDENSLKNLGV
jgi:hypothetical protein